MKEKRRKQSFWDEDGFTLPELLIVLAIIAVLSAIAYAKFPNVLNNAKIKADEQTLATVQTALDVYIADTGEAPVITGTSGTNAAFVELVTTLGAKGYLKVDTEGIKAQQKDKEFTYDSKTQLVDIAKQSTPAPSTTTKTP